MSELMYLPFQVIRWADDISDINIRISYIFKERVPPTEWSFFSFSPIPILDVLFHFEFLVSLTLVL